MPLESPRKPGTLNQAINNKGLEDVFIAGQGQKVTLVGKDGKNAATEPPGSEDLEFEKICRLLELGINVDQSIYISKSKGLVILGQGHDTRLYNVDINAIKNFQAHQAQQPEATDAQLESREESMSLV